MRFVTIAGGVTKADTCCTRHVYYALENIATGFQYLTPSNGPQKGRSFTLPNFKLNRENRASQSKIMLFLALTHLEIKFRIS